MNITSVLFLQRETSNGEIRTNRGWTGGQRKGLKGHVKTFRILSLERGQVWRAISFPNHHEWGLYTEMNRDDNGKGRPAKRILLQDSRLTLGWWEWEWRERGQLSLSKSQHLYLLVFKALPLPSVHCLLPMPGILRRLCLLPPSRGLSCLECPLSPWSGRILVDTSQTHLDSKTQITY